MRDSSVLPVEIRAGVRCRKPLHNGPRSAEELAFLKSVTQVERAATKARVQIKKAAQENSQSEGDDLDESDSDCDSRSEEDDDDDSESDNQESPSGHGEDSKASSAASEASSPPIKKKSRKAEITPAAVWATIARSPRQAGESTAQLGSRGSSDSRRSTRRD